MFRINFLAHSDLAYIPLLSIIVSGTIVMAKTDFFFYFWRQIQISTEISQNNANISRHWSNFETSGSQVHAPSICLQLAKNRLPIVKQLRNKIPTFFPFLKKSYLRFYPALEYNDWREPILVMVWKRSVKMHIHGNLSSVFQITIKIEIWILFANRSAGLSISVLRQFEQNAQMI